MLIYIIIFFEKLIENLLASFRAIVYTSGYKHLSALLTLLITSLWIVITSIVILDLTSDPLKVVVYAIGQTTGVYLGAKIEEKLALGKLLLYAVISVDNEQDVSLKLRSQGFGVTIVDGRGYENTSKNVLLIICKRKDINIVRNIIEVIEPNVIMMTKKPTSIIGSYIL